jgi:hypothetical protein
MTSWCVIAKYYTNVAKQRLKVLPFIDLRGVVIRPILRVSLASFGNSDRFGNGRGPIPVRFPAKHVPDGINMFALATSRLMVGAGACENRLDGIRPYLVFRGARIRLGWHKVKLALFFDPGQGRDFEAALFPDFDSSRNPIGDFIGVHAGYYRNINQ